MNIKPVSILAITIVGLMSAFPSNGAQMTSQIQRLLDQKEEKIKQLEKCEGKKQGWMIAGISTIGLTAVGVGVNIAQANKSNRLSGEIEQSKQELERQQERLSRIEGQISKKEQEAKAEKERAEREKAEREKLIAEWDGAVVGDPCGEGGVGTWTLTQGGDTECLSGENRGRCKCVSTSGSGGSSENVAPELPSGGSNGSGAGARVVGGDCIPEDLAALHIIKGHYITSGVKTKKCATTSGGELPNDNNCSCAADECDTSNGYEMQPGKWCKYVGKKSGNSGGTGKTGGGASGGTAATTKPADGVDTGGRVVGEKCLAEDINKLKPYGWLSGTYIRVGENVKTTLGVRCATKKGDNVKCSCRADECDSDKNYERDEHGLCVKQVAAAKQEEVQQPKQEQQEQPANASVTKYDASIDGEDGCYYDIDGDYKGEGGCRVSNPGDWGVKFNYGIVTGIAACSDLSGSYPNVASNQSKVDSAYTSTATSNPSGRHCYCKVTNSDIAGARWVFSNSFSDASYCAVSCAYGCAYYVQSGADFRRAVFGASAQ